MKTKLHILTHTHWDREWYLNSPYVNKWLPDFFLSIFRMMEKQPSYRYILDGQTCLIEDLLEEVQQRGLDEDYYLVQIKKYVEQNRLCIGPYYLQPDWQLISEESAIRNLLIGKQIAAQFGGRMNCGWIPDSFGQISQTTQLHNGFHLNGIFVWRGVNPPVGKIKTEYIWEAPDGSRTTAVYLLSSYRNAMRLADSPDIMKERLMYEGWKLRPFNTTANALMMNGYDQEMVPDDIMPAIESGKLESSWATVCQSTPDQYIQAIEQENPTLETLYGQQYNGRYVSVFPGILSSRIYIKQRNDCIERMIEKYTEPLCTVAMLLGASYPTDDLEVAWKNLMKNQPHDTICGVSVDAVYSDALERYSQVETALLPLLTQAFEKLVSAIDTSAVAESKGVYVVWNPLCTQRSHVVKIKTDKRVLSFCETNGIQCESVPMQEGYYVHVENLPAFGYKVLCAKEGTMSTLEHKQNENGAVLENDYLRAEINQNGLLTVCNKTTCKVYTDLHRLEDLADAGDEYNDSPLQNDCPISNPLQVAVELVEINALVTIYKIQQVFELPIGIVQDRQARCKNTRSMPVVTYITLKKNEPYLRFHTEIRNTVKDHHLRVLFPTDLETKQSYSKTQFDITHHPIGVDHYEASIPSEVQKVINGAFEPEPSMVFPQLSFAGLEDRVEGAAILNAGLRNYEVMPIRRTLAITLMRSVGQIARSDLSSRVGDAGPAIMTPEAQCLCDLNFDYAFYPYTGSVENVPIVTMADDFNQPVVVLGTNIHSGKLPCELSLFSIETDASNVSIGAMKKAQNSNNVVVRLCNYGENAAMLTLRCCNTIEKAFEATLDETHTCDLPIKDNMILMKIGAKKIKTLLLAIKEEHQASEQQTCVLLSEYLYPQEDFSNYEKEPLVTQAELSNEQARRERVLEHYKSTKLFAAEPCDALEKRKRMLRVYSLQRESLEARLSFLMMQKAAWKEAGLLTPQRIENAHKEMLEISTHLNYARVYKRAEEYILDYYEHHEEFDVPE